MSGGYLFVLLIIIILSPPMKIDDLHNKLVRHYQEARAIKNKKSIQIESIVGQSYKRKSKEVDESSPLEDFLRNEKHIVAEQEPLYFRTLPRRLKVHFPGPPPPPPKLQQVPYTYEIVPSVPYKIPKQKPGFVGDWVLEESRFADRSSFSIPSKKNKSMIENYRHTDRPEGKSKLTGSDHERRKRFRSQIKKLVVQMKEKNLSLKEIIKNKGMIKKPHNFYNSVDFFQMCRAGDKAVEDLLSSNPLLAFDIDEQEMTGLHWAARQGHVSLCRILTQKYKASCHVKDFYGRTPLHLAVEHKNIECIIRLFIEGGQLNAMNKDKKTVRMVANDAYIKYMIERLEEIKLAVKTRGIADLNERKAELETAIRNTLDESSLYF